MPIILDHNDPTPLFQQLHDQIVTAIAIGEISPMAKLGSVRSVAMEFGINPATVKKAYDLLQREGIVETSERNGTIACPHNTNPDPAANPALSTALRTLLARGIAQGYTADALLNHCRTLLAGFPTTTTLQGAEQ